MKITETRIITMEDLRRFCIERNLCELATNKDYDRILNSVKGVNFTTEKIVELSDQLMIYSETEEEQADICCGLAHISISIFEAVN